MGVWRMRRGEFALATEHFEKAIARLTRLNPNPYDGEAYYNLGVTLRYRLMEKQAYDAFYKATWNAAWRGSAYFALTEIDAKCHRWEQALEHARRCIDAEPNNMNARNLLGLLLKKQATLSLPIMYMSKSSPSIRSILARFGIEVSCPRTARNVSIWCLIFSALGSTKRLLRYSSRRISKLETVVFP